MTYKKELTINQRFTALQDLLKDAVKMGFSSAIICGYQQQLNEIETEIKNDKDKRAEFKKENKLSNISTT